MSARHMPAAWPRALSLSSIAAPVARLLQAAQSEQRRAFYPCEIERFRRDLEMQRAQADLQARFKVI